MSKTHIIGAGLAGLAAAVRLTKLGRQAVLYEAAPQAGGRCRSYADAQLGRVIDNGNHLILGANRHALAYVRAIGSGGSFVTGNRCPFLDLGNGKRFAFKPTLAVAALARLAFARPAQVVSDCIDTDSRLYRLFVEPFCTSALNTVPAKASAMLLRRALWEFVKHGPAGLRYYLPRQSLAQSLIDPALAQLSEVHLGSAVRSLIWEKGEVIALQFAGRQVSTQGDRVILATSAQAAAKLLPEAGIAEAPSAIVNGHFLCPELAWPAGQPFIGLLSGTAQWLFYRGDILSTTTSAANELAEKGHDEIAQLLWADVCKAQGVTLPLPAHRIIVEKHATRLATPASLAPVRRQYGNLMLAGDYTMTQLPATIDSAVRSGVEVVVLA